MLRRRNQVPPELLGQRLEELRHLLPDQPRHQPLEWLRLELVEQVQRRRHCHPVERMPRLEAVRELQRDAARLDAVGELGLGDAGRELAAGRDLAALKAQLGEAAQLTFATAGTGIEKGGIRAWDFGELPERIAFTRGGRQLTGYPALVDEGECVAIRLFDTGAAADAAMRGGVRRLMRLALKEQMRQLDRSLPGLTQAALVLRELAPADDWKENLVTAIADRAFIGEDDLPRGANAFEALKQRARTRLPAVREAACRLFGSIAEEYQRAQKKLAAAAKSLPQSAADVRAQLARLIFKGFLSATPWDRLHDLPRYLKAMQSRLDKYSADPERDQRHAGNIAELWRRYEERAAKLARAKATDARLEDFRWRIEELRVSLFAQELKTPYPVSYKRLDKLWSQIRA